MGTLPPPALDDMWNEIDALAAAHGEALRHPAGPGHHIRDEGALVGGQQRLEILTGEQAQESLVLGQRAAQRVHEQHAPVAIRGEEVADLRLPLHQLAEQGAAIDDVDRASLRMEPATEELE